MPITITSPPANTDQLKRHNQGLRQKVRELQEELNRVRQKQKQNKTKRRRKYVY